MKTIVWDSIFFMLIAMLSVSLPGCKKKAPDATTSASVKANEWLPKPDSTYTVIGFKSGIKGFQVEYNDALFRGGDILSPAGGTYLMQRGVKTVLSITPNENIKTICSVNDIEQLDFYYDYGALPDSCIIDYLNILDTVQKPVYIHCYSGKQRAGLLCAISRIYNESWSFEKALLEYEKLGGNLEQDTPLLRNASELIKLRSQITKESRTSNRIN